MFKTAIERAEAARKGAELRLITAKRTEALVHALIKTGRAEARHENGAVFVLTAQDDQFSSRLGNEQIQENIYYACADYACRSLLGPLEFSK